MHYLRHIQSDQLANRDCTGEHDVRPVDSCLEAAAFDTWGEASDFSQNFGPDWTVETFG
jgi:hypothetical protein